uniref:Uncharacterized protein n=1 Tax=Knipowitschia caucasica TaxID=637954 RepID=A0AAV2J9R4_KNICA
MAHVEIKAAHFTSCGEIEDTATAPDSKLSCHLINSLYLLFHTKAIVSPLPGSRSGSITWRNIIPFPVCGLRPEPGTERPLSRSLQQRRFQHGTPELGSDCITEILSSAVRAHRARKGTRMTSELVR